MKSLHLKHGYHDAFITRVEYKNDEIILDIELCSCCNPCPGPATLIFYRVRNFADVRSSLETAREKNESLGYVDEIIGIARDGKMRYLVDLETAGTLLIEAHRIMET